MENEYETCLSHYLKKARNYNRVQLQNVLQLDAQEIGLIASQGQEAISSLLAQHFEETWDRWSEEQRIDYLHEAVSSD